MRASLNQRSSLIAPTLLLLSEQIGRLSPGSRQSDYYINQLIAYMRVEWYKTRLLIADAVVNAFTKRTNESLLLEAVTPLFLPTNRANAMYRSLRAIMKNYKVGVTEMSAGILRKARSDAAPRLTITGTRAMLSQEGLQEVIDGFKWQKGFVDDYSKDVVTRIRRLTKGRYATKLDVRKQINRTFRIDRDQSLAKFHSAVDRLSNSVRQGRITPNVFQNRMQSEIHKHYRLLYQEGKNTKRLAKWEEDFIRRQADTQNQYLDKFRQELSLRKGMGQELTSKVNWRASLYAERGTSLFEAGHMASLPDDVLLTWTMHPAEHCSTCPIYAANSPYTKQSLPGFPGEGFHLTQCGTNCKCSVDISKLYVTKFPEAPEEELAIKVTKKPPPKPPVAPNRTSIDSVDFKGKTYKRVKLTSGVYRYDILDPKTGKVVNSVVSKGLPDDVRSTFRKKWRGPVPKVVGITKPAPRTPKPKVIKTQKPSPEVMEAMGKPKYKPPEEVRKEMGRMYEARQQGIETLRNQQGVIRKDIVKLGEEFDGYERMRKDPRYKQLADKMDAIDAQIRAEGKEYKAAIRRLVQTSETGFKIESNLVTTSAKPAFMTKADKGVREFTKYVDEDVVKAGVHKTVSVYDEGSYARAFASRSNIHISSQADVKTTIHEMGHWLEDSNPKIKSAANNFLNQRTRYETSVSLNEVKKTTAYRADEVTKKDKFIEAYMGKQYGGTVTELTSMSAQLMYQDPLKFAQRDPGMFDWAYKLFRGMS